MKDYVTFYCRKLYWIIHDTQTVYASELDGTDVVVVFHHDDGPYRIALHPERRWYKTAMLNNL